MRIELAQDSRARYSVEWQPDDRYLLRMGNLCLYDLPIRRGRIALTQPPLFADGMQG